jgi:hypothetical protein
MKKPIQNIEIELPVDAVMDLTVMAASIGVSLPYYLGILVLSGAYGFRHPDVLAFDGRPKGDINGPVIHKGRPT